MSGLPFVLACLAIGLVLSWLGTLAFPKHPGWVAIAIDVLLVFVVPYVPPFQMPGTSLSSCGSLWSNCDPSWHAVGAKAAAIPASHWIGAAAILAGPFIMCFFFASRAARTRPALRGRRP